jgi:hypothetical protein
MADKKITDLQQISAITDDLNFPVDDTLQTYRATIGQVKTYLAPIYISPTVQRFTSGSGTYNPGYAFIVSGANATVGATYTNNGNTYTVLKTVTSSNIVWLSGSASPTSSGTLTKASGTGDSTISFSAYRKSLYIRLKAVGGGGGGAGGGAGGGTGGGGGNTTFGSNLTAGGGAAGNFTDSLGGAGGTNTISEGFTVINVSGGRGDGYVSTGINYQGGKNGGISFFGGTAGSPGTDTAGQTVAANSGSGGSGGGTNSAAAQTGTGGGAGGFIEVLISSPGSYSYSIGSAGSAGSAGTNGRGGSAGSAGIVIVEEYYQ